MKKLFIILAIACITGNLPAQNFVAESELPNVPADGFYRVMLTPDVTAYLNGEFTNLRIYDRNNKETPYFLKFEVPMLYTTTFKEYEITAKQILKDSITVLTIANPQQKTIDNISLIIKNARVTKQASLYGSDDNRAWYILKDNFYLSDIESKTATSELKIVNFPLSNYRFYQLRIDDRSVGPLNILKAGYYSNGSEDGTYNEVPVKSFSQSELTSEKLSHVRVKFDTAHFVDRLQWDISGARLYKRNITVYAVEERFTKKGEKRSYVDYLASAEIHTGQPSMLQLSGRKVKEILIVVENNDDQPLTFQSIKAFQLNRYATVWLERDNRYLMRVGERNMSAPVYDIEYFRDSVPAETQIIKSKSIIPSQKEITRKEQTFFTSNWFIWTALIAVIIFLGLMSIKMVRETGVIEESKDLK